ncbi:MAG: hypothetical protein K2Y71_11570 [Xanthobacteraceae bacterium]|nr:hypothetical protein [Xanthobacteraceae bacterium]
MRFLACRRLIAVVTVALMTISAAAHRAMAAEMNAEPAMAMSAQASAMESHDAPCPMSSNCANDMNTHAMACFAHCASVVGVLAEPSLAPVTSVARPLERPLARSLASLHGPPDPHPPKLHIAV